MVGILSDDLEPTLCRQLPEVVKLRPNVLFDRDDPAVDCGFFFIGDAP